MRRSGRKLPVALLRGILLTVLTFAIVGLGFLYFVGRTSRPTPLPVENELTALPTGDLLRGEGFEHEVTREGKKIFVIRADRIASNEIDNFRLEGVELIFDRGEGDQYTIESDWSTYDRNTDEAVLEGSVKVSGPNDLVLTTAGLELKRQGNLVVSSAPIAIEVAQSYQGIAERISVNLKRNEFSLSGNVELYQVSNVENALTLKCQKLSFERKNHQIRAEGAVEIDAGTAGRLQAKRLSIVLSDDERTVRFMRARWNVKGILSQGGSGANKEQLRFDAMQLSAKFEEVTQQASRIELEGTPRETASIRMNGPGKSTRVLSSKYILGELSNGSVQSLELLRDVTLTDQVGPDASESARIVSGARGIAKFGANEQLVNFVLEDEVELKQTNLNASGDRLDSDFTKGETTLSGTPVTLKSDRGNLRAPRVVYTDDSERIEALEGVQAVLTESEGLRLWGAEKADEFIQVESESASWEGASPELKFISNVKAWQGGSFLLAKQLVAQMDSDRLAAVGSVRTVWRPQSDTLRDPAEPSRDPVEVNADELSYSKAERVLTYSGSARLRQGERTVSCDTMMVQTDDEEDIETLDCDGSARLEDAASGNTVVGEAIAYRPQEEFAKIIGDPVVLRDRQGTEIQGRQLRYDFQTGTAQLESRPNLLDSDPQPLED